MADSSEYHGSLVAFEGPADIISTQLRLLPSSPKILILPSLQHFMKGEERALPFDAHSHILRMHEACKARADMAFTFLRDSSPENKRLVFMNGGTSSAQLSCVTAISQHETGGDSARAETVFNELVGNGVAGLKRQTTSSSALESAGSSEEGKKEDKEDDDLPDDPISIAMRAADALDRETASLQPDNDIDLTIATRRRSMSVPILRIADDLEEAAPFYVFGAPVDSEQPIPLNEQPTGLLELKLLGRVAQSNVPKSPSSVWEAPGMRSPRSATAVDHLSPGVFTSFGSMPNTPAVVFGEARVVDMRSPFPARSARPHKRTKSVDRIYASAIRNQDISLCNFLQPLTPKFRDKTSLQTMVHVLDSAEKQRLRSKYYREIPNATIVKPRKMALRRSPPCPLDLSRAISAPSRRPSSYVDKGTNPETDYADKGACIVNCYLNTGVDARAPSMTGSDDDFELAADVPFDIVLPMVEDLVIHFKDERRDTLLESILRGFKEGSYPVSMPPLLPETQDGSDIPGTPTSRGSAMSFERSSTAAIHVSEQTTSPEYHSDADEYDPFATSNYMQPRRSLPAKQDAKEGDTIVAMPLAPATPAQTPPAASNAADALFHEFSTANCRTAVCVQNGLRSTLNVYFPPGNCGYHQFIFPQLPELSSLWKPVFRDAESGSPGKAKRRIDLILAIGAQKGVSKEFLSAISGSVEKLGTKPNGVTRSGRLDLRYLIANAMQAFTSQPLANQTQDNPFSNSLLLATLIVPHLETYMAAHSETRLLLLEYSPEHLSTVLALQRLVGVDLLKVAGVLRADSPEPKAFSRRPVPASQRSNHSNTPSTASSTASSRTGATLLAPAGSKSSEAPPFSKANFLLTSSASESEIATLVSTIWKILIDISQFYIPDGAPRPSTSHQNSQRNSKDDSPVNPFKNAFSEYAPLASAAAMMGFHTPPLSPSKMSTSADKVAFSPTPAQHDTNTTFKTPPSKASKPPSIKSLKAAKNQKTKLQKMLGEKAVLEFDHDQLRPSTASSYFDVSDDETGQFAADERKYIPLFLKKPALRKGNSRKALTWLGLA